MFVSVTVISLSVTDLTCPNLSNVIWGTLNLAVLLALCVTADVGPYEVSALIFVLVSAWLKVLLFNVKPSDIVNLSCLPLISWCDVITVPKSTTPLEPFVTPFILIPVTVPVFFVKPHCETVDSVIALGVFSSTSRTLSNKASISSFIDTKLSATISSFSEIRFSKYSFDLNSTISLFVFFNVIVSCPSA